ncbi:DNA primase [Streptomyces sp. NPDC051636]|uniref:DNA primase n=1 Tax=Streptomyces sp. NPDC051636 TaxID=3365663 RepID=UPI003793DD9B
MNRTALGLAVGAGYFLGRTKKLKMALAVGSLVAGKKLNLSPRALADLVNQQLRDNPQFKEIGDQLREDLRGVGKAASGAMAERQMNALADRLHGRTAQVRDRLSDVVPGTGSEDAEDSGGSQDREPRGDAEEASEERDEPQEPEDRQADGEAESEEESRETRKPAAKKAPAKKAPGKKAPAKKAPARKTAQKTQGAAGRPAAKKTAAAGNAARSRQSKGGDEG